MGGDNEPLTSQRGTSNRGAQARGLAGRATERPGMIMEIDQMRASIQVGFRAFIKRYNNTDLVAEAKRLNTQLFESDDKVGPLEKKAIAESLIQMHREMDQRIQEAAVKQGKALPTLEGIQWKKDDPLAGIVEGIQPFGMIDWWGTFLQISDIKASQHVVKKARPKIPKLVPPPPPKPSEKHFPVPPPSPKPNIDDIIRAVKISKVEPPERKIRLLCYLEKLKRSDVIPYYWKGNSTWEEGVKFCHKWQIEKVRGKEVYTKLFDPIEFAKTVVPLMQRRRLDAREWLIKEIAPEKEDSERITKLLYLDSYIYESFAYVAKYMSQFSLGGGSSASPYWVAIAQFLADALKNPKSLYSCIEQKKGFFDKLDDTVRKITG